MARLNWTKQESNVIIDCVKSYPSNLSFAFEQAATELPQRTAKSIAVQYYKNLRNQTTALAVMSSKGIATLGNQKNSRRDLKQELSTEDQIEIILGMIKKLKRDEKKSIVKAIFNL
jgi:hypothetical protein